MKVEKTFVVGDKIIFAGTFQSKGQGECKGPAFLSIDGKRRFQFRVEGEVFDNTPEPSLWAYVTPGLSGLELAGHDTIISSSTGQSL